MSLQQSAPRWKSFRLQVRDKLDSGSKTVSGILLPSGHFIKLTISVHDSTRGHGRIQVFIKTRRTEKSLILGEIYQWGTKGRPVLIVDELPVFSGDQLMIEVINGVTNEVIEWDVYGRYTNDPTFIEVV